MAKVVEYYENNKPEHYTEGPFVVVNLPGNGGFRIEQFLDGHCCSILPSDDVLNYLKINQYPMRSLDLEQMKNICDILNKLYKKGLFKYVMSMIGREN